MKPTPEQMKEFRASVAMIDRAYAEICDSETAKGLERMMDAADDLSRWGCFIDSHKWGFIGCDHWQHQQCEYCHAAKYPELIRTACDYLDSDMTEAEYLEEGS